MKFLSLCVDTTGTDFVKDQIIRITAVTNTYGSTENKSKIYIIRPDREFSISDEITENTGLLYDVIMEQGVQFSLVAQEIADMIAEADAIIAYKAAFHINFLQYYFDSLAIDPHFELHSIIDPYLIEVATNSHKLDDVYARFLGDEPADNNAEKVLKLFVKGQMATIDNSIIKEYRDQNDIQHYPDGWVKMEDCVLKFNKGQYKDQPVIDIIKKDSGYIKWLCKSNLVTMPTRRAFKAVIEEIKQECK